MHILDREGEEHTQIERKRERAVGRKINRNGNGKVE
jgi:hypothetical protein